jgi:hypothetical protein
MLPPEVADLSLSLLAIEAKGKEVKIWADGGID